MANRDQTKVQVTIQEEYIRYVTRKGRPPATTFKFCKKLGISESEFFTAFPSLEAVEKAIWLSTLEHSMTLTLEIADFDDYPLKEKLLTGLFNYAEHNKNNRSFMIYTWPGLRRQHRTTRVLARSYRNYINDWIFDGIARGECSGCGQPARIYAQIFSLHYLAVIDFWLKDETSDFERTDAFIEKTVQFATDLIRRGAVDSAVDLARFFAGGIR